jgi:hypothetical protein
MPRRSRHRIPPSYTRPSDPIDERYQAEIDAYTARLERRHRRAVQAVEHAEARYHRAQDQHVAQRQLADLAREVSRRLDELAAIERLMQPSNHASALHRGVASYGKVG